MDSIPLNQPDILGQDAEVVMQALGSLIRQDSSTIDRFERACCDASGRSIAIPAGTASLALQASLLAMNISQGDEVLCPALAPARLVLAIVRAGATPVFVDVHPRHGAMHADSAEQAITEQTRAIALTAPCGNPSGFSSIAAVSRKYEVPLIEDAVESFGATIGNDRAGCFGVVSVIGFDRDSPLCAAGGAAILTDNDVLANTCRQVLDEGRLPVPGIPAEESGTIRTWQYDRRGVDGALDPLRAALALIQLDRRHEVLDRRAEIAETYVRRLGPHPDLVLPTPPSDARPSWPAFPVRLDERFLDIDRDEIVIGLLRHDIGASGGWPLAPMLPSVVAMGMIPDDWPIASRFADRTIRLPSHARLTDGDIDVVCSSLELIMEQSVHTRE